jgi:hypothetical protein
MKFMPNFAMIHKHLHQLTMKTADFCWGPDEQNYHGILTFFITHPEMFQT